MPHPLLKDGADLTLAKIDWEGKSIWWPGIKFSSVSHMMRNIDDAIEESHRTKQMKSKLFLSARAEWKNNTNAHTNFVVQLFAIDSVRFFSDDRDLCSFYVYALEDINDLDNTDEMRQKAYQEAIAIVETTAEERRAFQIDKLSPVKKARGFLSEDRKEERLHIVVSTVKSSSQNVSSPTKMHLRDSIWLESLSKLMTYKKEYGHTNVPNKWRKDPALGEWVQVQRKEFLIYKNGTRNYLTNEKVNILNAIGFEWNVEIPKTKKRLERPRKQNSERCVLITKEVASKTKSQSPVLEKVSGECTTRKGEIWAVARKRFFPDWTYDEKTTRTSLYNFFHHRPGLENKSYKEISEDETLKHGVDYFFHVEEMKEYARTHFNWIDPHCTCTRRKKRGVNDTKFVDGKRRSKRRPTIPSTLNDPNEAKRGSFF